MRHQRPDDADMGEAACGTAAQRKPDYRPADAAESYLFLGIGTLLAAPHPAIQHANSPAALQYSPRRGSARTVDSDPPAWFMPTSAA
jgi:hypothetical protein